MGLLVAVASILAGVPAAIEATDSFMSGGRAALVASACTNTHTTDSCVGGHRYDHRGPGSQPVAPLIVGIGGGAIVGAHFFAAEGAGGGSRLLPFSDANRLSEVNNTLDRIDTGGPHPYSQDGTVFQNREGRLPSYREYTVDTPGAADRGARRIVVGDDGRYYYTDDHYGSFTQIDPRRYS